MKYYDLRWMSSFFAQDGGSFEINESSDIFDFGVAGWLLSDFRSVFSSFFFKFPTSKVWKSKGSFLFQSSVPIHHAVLPIGSYHLPKHQFFYYLQPIPSTVVKYVESIWHENLLLLMCFESATKWLYPKNVSGSVHVLKTEDKCRQIGLFQKCIIAFEKFLLFWVPMNI